MGLIPSFIRAGGGEEVHQKIVHPRTGSPNPRRSALVPGSEFLLTQKDLTRCAAGDAPIAIEADKALRLPAAPGFTTGILADS